MLLDDHLFNAGNASWAGWSHHRDDGRFIGLIDPDLIRDEIARTAPCVGPAGSMSVHHVRALHGSVPDTSSRSRNLLLYEVGANDTHDRDAGAASAAATAAARFNLRDAIGREEVILRASGMTVAPIVARVEPLTMMSIRGPRQASLRTRSSPCFRMSAPARQSSAVYFASSLSAALSAHRRWQARAPDSLAPCVPTSSVKRDIPRQECAKPHTRSLRAENSGHGRPAE